MPSCTHVSCVSRVRNGLPRPGTSRVQAASSARRARSVTRADGGKLWRLFFLWRAPLRVVDGACILLDVSTQGAGVLAARGVAPSFCGFVAASTTTLCGASGGFTTVLGGCAAAPPGGGGALASGGGGALGGSSRCIGARPLRFQEVPSARSRGGGGALGGAILHRRASGAAEPRRVRRRDCAVCSKSARTWFPG